MNQRQIISEFVIEPGTGKAIELLQGQILRVEQVEGVYLEEKFGSPEAVWVLRVKDFPAVVTMDAHGQSLHQEVADVSKGRLQGVLTAK